MGKESAPRASRAVRSFPSLDPLRLCFSLRRKKDLRAAADRVLLVPLSSFRSAMPCLLQNSWSILTHTELKTKTQTSVVMEPRLRPSRKLLGRTYMYLLGICPFPSFCAFSSSCQAIQYPKLPFGSVSSTYRISSLLKLSSCSTSATLS